MAAAYAFLHLHKIRHSRLRSEAVYAYRLLLSRVAIGG
jgi:hypothetical protein